MEEMRLRICHLCDEKITIDLIQHIIQSHDNVIDSYNPSYRHRSLLKRNKKSIRNPEIIGWEPYNNIDAIFTGDNKRMMYWELKEFR